MGPVRCRGLREGTGVNVTAEIDEKYPKSWKIG